MAPMLREATRIPCAVISEMARVTHMNEAAPGFGNMGQDLASCIDAIFYADCYIPRPARWTNATKKELKNLQKSLQSARSKVECLSHDSLGFLAGSPFYSDVPMRVRVPKSIELVNAFQVSVSDVLHSIDTCLFHNQAKQGDGSKRHYEDANGTFYFFAEVLMEMIVWRGGSVTVDKNFRRGTVVKALDLLRPYLPSDGLPEFLTVEDSSVGLSRLDDIRTKVVSSVRG